VCAFALEHRWAQRGSGPGRSDPGQLPGLIRFTLRPSRGRRVLANQPKSNVRITRWYRGKTLVLETRFETSDGGVTLVDCIGASDLTLNGRAGGTVGMLTRYNRKAVTVITDDGRQWNVSPSAADISMRGPRAPTSENFLVQYGVGLSCLGSVEF
jgi:hypothetical protein